MTLLMNAKIDSGSTKLTSSNDHSRRATIDSTSSASGKIAMPK